MQRSSLRAWQLALCSLVAISTLAISTQAFAFCRLTTDSINYNSQAATCDTKGVPLHWASNHLTFRMQRDASASIDLATASSVAEASFKTWESLDCSQCTTTSLTGKPSFVVDRLDPTHDSCLGFHSEWLNSNTIMFRDKSWADCDGTAQPNADSILALTVHTYKAETGEIFDADIEINTAHNSITTSSSGIAFDLQSILTHESGHFLGLAHTEAIHATSTMYYQYVAGSTTMRTPQPDDICGICTLYPPGQAINDAEVGFFCRFHPASRSRYGIAAIFVTLAMLAWQRRRSRGIRQRA